MRTERRPRRIPRGQSVNAGPLSHQSTNQPAPLGKLEEAILITCITGITGVRLAGALCGREADVNDKFVPVMRSAG